MSAFEFATANRIIFGAGKLNGLGDQLKGRAKRLLLVCGNSSDAIPRVREILSAQGIPFDEFHVHGEPTVDTASEGVKLALEHGADMVIGLGGGSVLDAGKAIAALATNRGDVFDYLEVIGKGQPLMNAPLPYIAIPTTAGTGTEVTRNAVLESPAHGVKVSLRSPLMLPSIALVDPELTYTLPPAITASSGLDALTQLIEPFVSVKANPMTDAICREGIRHAARSLRRAYQNGADTSARVKACRWQVYLAGWHWQMPRSAPCMDSQVRWEGCSTRRMERTLRALAAVGDGSKYQGVASHASLRILLLKDMLRSHRSLLEIKTPPHKMA